MTERNQEPQTSDPQPSRPYLPEGYGVPKTLKGTLQWSKAREALEEAKVYWVCTVRPDGRPHARPVWGMWVGERLYFDGSPETVWVRNLTSNPAVEVHIEQGGLVVILEGIAEHTKPEPSIAKHVADVSATKYDYRPDTINGVYAVRPIVAYAWYESLKSATRWRFNED
jgi:general stress protein 26